MSIWSALFATREDAGLEATLIRPLFEGMADLNPDVDACTDWVVVDGTWSDARTWIDACTWSD